MMIAVMQYCHWASNNFVSLILTFLYIVVLKVVKLSKESRNDQYGYVISSPILQDKYLQVTEQSLGSKKCTVKFTAPKQIKVK